jgi:hypothetical protein
MERGSIVYLIAVGVMMGICAALFRLRRFQLTGWPRRWR